MPITPSPAPRLKVGPAESARARTAPAALIDRRLVAGALDRRGPAGRPDGVISREELEEAGIKRVDADALAAINAKGEQGEAITVGELAAALAADQVVITSEGALAIENRRGAFKDGAIAPSTPWAFPEVADLTVLERYHDLVPRLRRYHPSYPDGYYVDRVLDGYDRVQTGTRKVYDGRDKDGNAVYRDEPVYEDRPRYRDEIQYDRLLRDLRRKGEQVLEASRDARDPELVRARQELQAAHDAGGSIWGWSESRCRRYYRALEAYERIQTPARPATHAQRLDAALKATETAIAEQDRIAASVPVAEARRVIETEVKRLKGPTASNAIVGALAAAGAGAAGFFGLAGVLAGLPLIGAAAGIGLAAGGLGWLAAQLFKGGKAKYLQRDLDVLSKIDPAENREELEQHALASYRLLQDARTADTLTGVRGFEAEAKRVAAALGTVKQRAEDETKSLRTVEQWVLKGRG